MNNYEAIVAALAKAAFTLHYEATRRPDWATAEQHWKANPGARELWTAIVTGTLVGAERAGASALPGNAASGLSARMTRPGGPMTPIPPREVRRSPALAMPYGGKQRVVSGDHYMRQSAAAHKMMADLPPGLAIERHDCEPSPEEREYERAKLGREHYVAEEPDPHVAQALREHNSGEPEE